MKPGIAKHAKQDMKPGIALQGPCQQSGQDMAPSHRCLFWLLAVTGSMEPYQQNGAAHWRSRSYKTWNWSTLASQVCYHCNNHIDAYNNSNKITSIYFDYRYLLCYHCQHIQLPHSHATDVLLHMLYILLYYTLIIYIC